MYELSSKPESDLVNSAHPWLMDCGPEVFPEINPFLPEAAFAQNGSSQQQAGTRQQ